MKRIQLDGEERALMSAIERDEFVLVTGKELEEVARAIKARKKDLTVTIRVNSLDILKIKKKAKKLGIRYQSYVSEVLHKVAEQ